MFHGLKVRCITLMLVTPGGNSRIRTYGRLLYDGLANRCLKPLSHISIVLVVRFELTLSSS